jgi:hypothetical protein
MPTTIVSPLVHSPDEHSIVATFHDATLEKIVSIQRQLKSLLGDVIWLTPPQALHMTLMEIICDTEYTGLSRKEHFQHWYEKYNDRARETLAQFLPVHLGFNELLASRGAIIIKTADSTSFNHIRDELLKSTVLPAQTKIPPDITHCSLGRYNEAVDLEMVQEKVRAITVDLEEVVREFKLMKDLGPDFHPTQLETYPCTGAGSR